MAYSNPHTYHNTKTATSGSVAITTPPTAGQLLVAAISVQSGTSGNVQLPSGWTSVSGSSFAGWTGSWCTRLFYKIAVGTEASVGFTWSGNASSLYYAEVDEFHGFFGTPTVDPTVAGAAAVSATGTNTTGTSIPTYAALPTGPALAIGWLLSITTTGAVTNEVFRTNNGFTVDQTVFPLATTQNTLVGLQGGWAADTGDAAGATQSQFVWAWNTSTTFIATGVSFYDSAITTNASVTANCITATTATKQISHATKAICASAVGLVKQIAHKIVAPCIAVTSMAKQSAHGLVATCGSAASTIKRVAHGLVANCITATTAVTSKAGNFTKNVLATCVSAGSTIKQVSPLSVASAICGSLVSVLAQQVNNAYTVAVTAICVVAASWSNAITKTAIVATVISVAGTIKKIGHAVLATCITATTAVTSKAGQFVQNVLATCNSVATRRVDVTRTATIAIVATATTVTKQTAHNIVGACSSAVTSASGVGKTAAAICATAITRSVRVGKSIVANVISATTAAALKPGMFVQNVLVVCTTTATRTVSVTKTVTLVAVNSVATATKQVGHIIGTTCVSVANRASGIAKSTVVVCGIGVTKTASVTHSIGTQVFSVASNASQVGKQFIATCVSVASATFGGKFKVVNVLAVCSSSASRVAQVSKSILAVCVSVVKVSAVPSVIRELFARGSAPFVTWFGSLFSRWFGSPPKAVEWMENSTTVNWSAGPPVAASASGSDEAGPYTGEPGIGLSQPGNVVPAYSFLSTNEFTTTPWSAALAITTISSQSTIYVEASITSAIDPTLDVVQFAFLGPYPTTNAANTAVVTTATTWYTGSWGTPTTFPTTYPCQCLVGPNGLATLATGIYGVWVMITDNPEIPVLWCGPLVVS